MKKIFLLLLLPAMYNFAQGYICAIGGGSEDYNDWSDKPYGWIVEKSDSGKIIILGISDATNWLPDYFKHLGAKEVYNKKISSKSLADQQNTYDEIITAKAIFVRGGDQYDYVRNWKGTKTEEAIKYIFNNGGVVAGTSAGAMVLGSVDFTARSNVTDPKSWLKNPFINTTDFEHDFLNLAGNILFDTHFVERGRFGRLIPFIINLHNQQKDILGIGIDDRTAFCIDKNNIGTVMGSGAVTFFRSDNKTEFNGSSVFNLLADQLTEDFSFDLNAKKIKDIPSSAKNIDTTNSIKYPEEPLIWLSGSNDIDENINSGLNTLLNMYKSMVIYEPTLIIYDNSYQSQVNTLTEFLKQNGFIGVDTLKFSSSILESNYAADKISNSHFLIFLGSPALTFQPLIDSSTLIGSKFQNKILTERMILYFFGNTGKLLSEFFVDNVDNNYLASYHGQMNIEKGFGLFKELIFQPMLCDNSDFYENRTSALLYGMMRNRKRIGVYLTDDANINIAGTFLRNSQNSIFPFIYVDARNTTLVDSSKYISGSGYKQRQVAAMNNLRFTVSNKISVLNLFSGIFTCSQSETNVSRVKKFNLFNNYPNPFNSQTIISYQLSTPTNVKLKVYDVLGRELIMLVDDYQQAGFYKINFDSEKNYNNNYLPSGIYLFRLETDSYSSTKKMVLLR